MLHTHTTYRPRTRTRTVYYDSPTTVYSSPNTVYTSPSISVFPPPSVTETAFHNGLWAVRLESVTIAGGAFYLYENHVRPALEDEEMEDEEDAGEIYEAELAATRALIKELKAEHAETDPLVSAIQQPRSGRYEGRSAEDDDGDQGVVTHLAFRRDGTVDGWGEDGEDGRYTIQEGVWSTTGGDETMLLAGGRVAWIEKYDEGFEVALRGQIRADGTIRAMWASSVGVSGSVELACN